MHRCGKLIEKIAAIAAALPGERGWRAWGGGPHRRTAHRDAHKREKPELRYPAGESSFFSRFPKSGSESGFSRVTARHEELSHDFGDSPAQSRILCSPPTPVERYARAAGQRPLCACIPALPVRVLRGTACPRRGVPGGRPVRPRCRGSSAAAPNARDGAASAAPWPRSGECAHGSHRTVCRPLPACDRYSFRCRSASAAPSPLAA
jgi:hypothetical protein